MRANADELNLDAERPTSGQDALTRMMIYSPRDEVTSSRLNALVARPASQLSLAG